MTATELAARAVQEGDLWKGYVDVDGEQFWEGGPYSSEAEALELARERMRLFSVLLMTAKEEP